jgi:hypothetical protein
MGLLRRDGIVLHADSLSQGEPISWSPLTGEPDAGDPPVRFGGREGGQSVLPTPIITRSHVTNEYCPKSGPRPLTPPAGHS